MQSRKIHGRMGKYTEEFLAAYSPAPSADTLPETKIAGEEIAARMHKSAGVHKRSEQKSASVPDYEGNYNREAEQNFASRAIAHLVSKLAACNKPSVSIKIASIADVGSTKVGLMDALRRRHPKLASGTAEIELSGPALKAKTASVTVTMKDGEFTVKKFTVDGKDYPFTLDGWKSATTDAYKAYRCTAPQSREFVIHTANADYDSLGTFDNYWTVQATLKEAGYILAPKHTDNQIEVIDKYEDRGRLNTIMASLKSAQTETQEVKPGETEITEEAANEAEADRKINDLKAKGINQVQKSTDPTTGKTKVIYSKAQVNTPEMPTEEAPEEDDYPEEFLGDDAPTGNTNTNNADTDISLSDDTAGGSDEGSEPTEKDFDDILDALKEVIETAKDLGFVNDSEGEDAGAEGEEPESEGDAESAEFADFGGEEPSSESEEMPEEFTESSEEESEEESEESEEKEDKKEASAQRASRLKKKADLDQQAKQVLADIKAKIEAIRKAYPNDPKLQQTTAEIWKALGQTVKNTGANVNPSEDFSYESDERKQSRPVPKPKKQNTPFADVKKKMDCKQTVVKRTEEKSSKAASAQKRAFQQQTTVKGPGGTQTTQVKSPTHTQSNTAKGPDMAGGERLPVGKEGNKPAKKTTMTPSVKGPSGKQERSLTSRPTSMPRGTGSTDEFMTRASRNGKPNMKRAQPEQVDNATGEGRDKIKRDLNRVKDFFTGAGGTLDEACVKLKLEKREVVQAVRSLLRTGYNVLVEDENGERTVHYGEDVTTPGIYHIEKEKFAE